MGKIKTRSILDMEFKYIDYVEGRSPVLHRISISSRQIILSSFNLSNKKYELGESTCKGFYKRREMP